MTKKKVTKKKVAPLAKHNCLKCVHRRGIPGDAHSRCNNFKAHVVRNPTGIRGGWAMWPLNFDPTWIDSCDGYSVDPKKNMPEQKMSPLAEILAMLR